MKILVLNGSPKKKSDTMRLTDAFVRGLKKTGDHEITIVNVIDKQIAPCRGCFGCWKVKNGHCVIQDDQNAILDLYRDMDLVIWSFPLYCYGMPSHIKAVLDRTIPLNQMKMEIVDGHTRHIPLVDFSRLHTVVISGCGFPNSEHNFEALDRECELSFGNLTKIFVPETPLLNVPLAACVADPKIAAFERAGEEYTKSYSLSASTLADLQSLMIPMEEYIRNINGGV
ncbi:MAG: flavodoxin family protein [Treponema sp.]|nr:flavodoxin family protein [Candidatus Treponema caballi]